MKVRGAPAVTLQIHHLDEGDETDFVLSHVERAAAISKCGIERPSDETNSILIHCLFNHSSKEERFAGLLGVAELLITSLTKEEVEAVRSIDVELTLVVESGSWFVHLDSSLLIACGEKSISIRVIDNEKFLSGLQFRAGV